MKREGHPTGSMFESGPQPTVRFRQGLEKMETAVGHIPPTMLDIDIVKTQNSYIKNSVLIQHDIDLVATNKQLSEIKQALIEYQDIIETTTLKKSIAEQKIEILNQEIKKLQFEQQEEIHKEQKLIQKTCPCIQTLLNPFYVDSLRIFSDEDIVKNLEQKMIRRGWRGLPIVGIMYNGKIKALTGAHRIEAARRANLDYISIWLWEISFYPQGDILFERYILGITKNIHFPKLLSNVIERNNKKISKNYSKDLIFPDSHIIIPDIQKPRFVNFDKQLHKPKISFYGACNRPEMWMAQYENLSEGKFKDFEIIYCGNVYPDFPMPNNMRFIYSAVKPSQCSWIALSYAIGHIVIQINDDFVYSPCWLDKMWSFYEKEQLNKKEKIVVDTCFRLNDGSISPFLKQKVFAYGYGEVAFPDHLSTCYFPLQGFFTKRYLFDAGGFDIRFVSQFHLDETVKRFWSQGGIIIKHPSAFIYERIGQALYSGQGKIDNSIMDDLWADGSVILSNRKDLIVNTYKIQPDLFDKSQGPCGKWV